MFEKEFPNLFLLCNTSLSYMLSGPLVSAYLKAWVLGVEIQCRWTLLSPSLPFFLHPININTTTITTTRDGIFHPFDSCPWNILLPPLPSGPEDWCLQLTHLPLLFYSILCYAILLFSSSFFYCYVFCHLFVVLFGGGNAFADEGELACDPLWLSNSLLSWPSICHMPFGSFIN